MFGGVSYMGTKRQLAGRVAAAIADCRQGPFVDLFAGMCSVGSAVAPTRQVWSNDVQHFAHQVAVAHFCSNELPISAMDAAHKTAPYFLTVRKATEIKYEQGIAREHKAVAAGSVAILADLFEQALEVRTRKQRRATHDLFTSSFAGTFFGYRQCIEIDSIRVALDMLLDDRELSADGHRWLLIALCVAISRCSNSTGHFAQALRPKKKNLNRLLSQRRRSVWSEWLTALSTLAPVGSRSWRARNKVFRCEAVSLLRSLAESRDLPRVVYADPPYTKDQYSRYYHVYETLLLYDYPPQSGRGQYRPDRWTSAFSLASQVDQAMSDLIASCAALNCDLVVSYPTNGLLPSSRHRIPELIQQHYGKLPAVVQMRHSHSTMGASKGAATTPVTEMLYQVRS